MIAKDGNKDGLDNEYPAARLEGWSVAIVDGQLHMIGRVWGHPRLVDGRLIITSPVVWVADDCSCARTLNTLYQLGHMSEFHDS